MNNKSYIVFPLRRIAAAVYDIFLLLDQANKKDAFLITTEKDHVRIPNEFKSSVGIIHGEIVSDNNLGFTTEIEKYI